MAVQVTRWNAQSMQHRQSRAEAASGHDFHSQMPLRMVENPKNQDVIQNFNQAVDLPRSLRAMWEGPSASMAMRADGMLRSTE